MTVINYPGPYGLRFFYTTTHGNHKLELNVEVDGDPAPGTGPASIDLVQKDSSLDSMANVVDALFDLFKVFYPSADNTWDRAELWKYQADSFNADYIATADIADDGTSGSPSVAAGEAIYSFRTSEGGVMKVVFEETTQPAGVTQSYADLGTAPKAFVDYVLSNDSVPLGRDTSRPISFLHLNIGQNERWFKKIYRP
jgi:hypothetical protein